MKEKHSSPSRRSGMGRRGVGLLDAGAMLLSGVCLIHCLALPFAIAALPIAFAGVLSDESFHLWMLLAVVPSSFAALLVGSRHHRNRRVLGVGIGGVLLLACAVMGDMLHWMTGQIDTTLTVIGALLLGIAHTMNFVLHRRRHPVHSSHAVLSGME